MVVIGSLTITPSTINSSCAWASDHSQLQALYTSPYTGAVTTRTATMEGFQEDSQVHRVVFTSDSQTTLNSYGYSPHPLSTYLSWIRDILNSDPSTIKPFIISITSSSPPELSRMVGLIQELRNNLGQRSNLIGIELNTSCPNIPSHPPPSYDPPTLKPLLLVLAQHYGKDQTLTIGLKLPPYLYRMQFTAMLECIETFNSINEDGTARNPFAFLTCTNTLGNSLLFDSQMTSASSGLFALPTPLGGLAGTSIHALSLGNVYTFSQLLSTHPSPAIRNVKVIGVGGVADGEGVGRMRDAGAAVVGCATALGREGVDVFKRLVNDEV